MEAVVTALTTGITSSSLFATVEDIMPLVIAFVPFVLGLYFLRKIIRGLGHGKLKF